VDPCEHGDELSGSRAKEVAVLYCSVCSNTEPRKSDGKSVKFEIYTANKRHEIFSGNQPCQCRVKNQN
jgi:hypothetical protein